MRFLVNESTIIYLLCTSMLVVMASATHDCKFQDYRMETFIGASANYCTPNEMKEMDETLDKVIYQIFPTIRGLEQADMTTCSSKGKYPSAGRQLKTSRYYRCTFCFESFDACIGGCRRRNLEQCRHQSWETIHGNNNMMHLTTTKNTFQKAINLSSRTTYVKVDFTLSQQQSNNIIQVKIDGHSPVLLKYIENETSRFRKNGILSASENYIRDGEGNLQYTKVVLHIDLSSFDFDEDKELLLQFKMISTDSDEDEEDDEEVSSVIDDLVIKAANACAFKWSNQESTSKETAAVTTLERETEWILSDKLTAVLNAISDANVNHCLNGRDPVVYVNLYKVSDHHEEGHLMC